MSHSSYPSEASPLPSAAPRGVKRGETGGTSHAILESCCSADILVKDPPPPRIAFIDFCSFTVRQHVVLGMEEEEAHEKGFLRVTQKLSGDHWEPRFEPVELLLPVLQRLMDLSVDEIKWKNRGRFNYVYTVVLGGGALGFVAFGGERQRGTILVSLTGQGCSRVNDWGKFREWVESLGAKLTRVDCAHDDFEGESIHVEKSREWYIAGLWSDNGRPPGQDLKGDWDVPGSPNGRTYYVGSRDNGKYCRTYEKGKQLGDPTSPWNRVEVEFRNKDRVIPYDILTNPGNYLAGAYPPLRFLSEIQKKIKTIQKAATITYQRMKNWLSQAAGPALNVMLKFHRGDVAGVLNEIVRDAIPKRLEPFANFMPDILYQGAT